MCARYDYKTAVCGRSGQGRRGDENMTFVDESVTKNCKNLIDSYGEICVFCNCCGRVDKATMYDAQIATYAEQLQEFAKHLSSADYEDFQKRNCADTIIQFAKEIKKVIKAKQSHQFLEIRACRKKYERRQG